MINIFLLQLSDISFNKVVILLILKFKISLVLFVVWFIKIQLEVLLYLIFQKKSVWINGECRKEVLLHSGKVVLINSFELLECIWEGHLILPVVGAVNLLLVVIVDCAWYIEFCFSLCHWISSSLEVLDLLVDIKLVDSKLLLQLEDDEVVVSDGELLADAVLSLDSIPLLFEACFGEFVCSWHICLCIPYRVLYLVCCFL